MKNFCLIVLSFLSFQSLVAQDVSNFKVLISEGEVPAGINMSSAEKVKEQSKEISGKNVYDNQSAKKFILESNYIIDKILSNGLVIYGGKLTGYVEKVADELLKNDKALRNELSFYIVKSPQVNAFATDRGEIFITVGLLAQIENEAQLAYIISHELIHYKEKHAKEGFVENEKIDRATGKYQGMDWNKLLSKSKYSKELEMQADQEGLDIYLKSNYSLREIDEVFYVLQYSHLPIDDVPFNRDYFNDEYFNLYASNEDIEVTQIEAIDDDNDEYQDHPNINKRRAVVNNEIEGVSNEGRVEFVNDKNEFLEIQALSRFELSFLYAKNRYYGESIYNSYLLLKKYPDNKFLKINIGYCLYAFAKYKNDSKIHSVLTDYDDVQGESQTVFHLFNKVEKEELNVLAVKYLWDLKEQIKDDKFLDKIAADAIKEMLMESGVRKLDFEKKLANESEEKSIDSSSLSKYDKIKSKQKEEGASYEYAFVELFKNEEFKELISYYEKAYVDKAVNDDEIEFESNNNKKMRLGLDKMVMVSPDYRHFHARRKFYEKYSYSDNKEENFIKLNQTIAERKKVDLNVIDNRFFNSTEEYNNMSLLNNWMEERYSHLNLKIYPYCSMYTDDLIDKYGTQYFSWSGVYSFFVGKKGLGWALSGAYLSGATFGALSGSFVAMGIGAAIPIIYYIANPSKRSFYYNYLFDISNYNALLVNEKFKKGVPMNMYIGDSFNQISAKPYIKK